MKKLLLSLLSLMVVTTGAKAQVMFGPEIGGLFSNYTGKEGGSSLESKAKFGLRVGGVADISILGAKTPEDTSVPVNPG